MVVDDGPCWPKRFHRKCRYKWLICLYARVRVNIKGQIGSCDDDDEQEGKMFPLALVDDLISRKHDSTQQEYRRKIKHSVVGVVREPKKQEDNIRDAPHHGQPHQRPQILLAVQRCRSGGDYQFCFSTASSPSSLCLGHITLVLFGRAENLTSQLLPDGPLPTPQKLTSHLICGATHSTPCKVSYDCFLVEGCL